MSLLFRDQILHVFDAALLRVTLGANEGDALGGADALHPGDVYRLAAGARAEALHLAPDVATVEACLTFMTPQATMLEVLSLTEAAPAGRRFALPLGPLQPGIDHHLIAVDPDAAPARLAQSRCATFLRGTRITLRGGAQMPVEDLQAGDLVLTRDDGPRPLVRVTPLTALASGPFAPVRIRAGVLNNARDLVVAPDHRLFVYQRSDALGAGRAEVLIRARDLIDGDAVRQEPGGYVDYVQLQFDRHQIVFAEGIGMESQRLHPAPGAPAPQAGGLPQRDVAERWAGIEAPEALLKIPDCLATLKRASKS